MSDRPCETQAGSISGHCPRTSYLKALRLSTPFPQRQNRPFPAPAGVSERSSPATRQSRGAKRTAGPALDGRRSGGYRFPGPAGARSLSPSRPCDRLRVRPVSYLIHARSGSARAYSATGDIAPSIVPASMRLGARSRRSHIFALWSGMRMSQRRVAIT